MQLAGLYQQSDSGRTKVAKLVGLLTAPSDLQSAGMKAGKKAAKCGYW